MLRNVLPAKSGDESTFTYCEMVRQAARLQHADVSGPAEVSVLFARSFIKKKEKNTALTTVPCSSCHADVCVKHF